MYMVIIVLRRALDWIQVAEYSPVVFFFLIVAHSILGDPGDVSRVGWKGATMVFKHGLKSTKKIFFYLILCPQIGEQHLLRYFSVFVHDSAILFRFVHQRVKCTQSRNGQLDIDPVHFKILSTQKLKHGNESGCFKTLSFQKFKLASITPSCFLKIVIINII